MNEKPVTIVAINIYAKHETALTVYRYNSFCGAVFLKLAN
jgi:hypothetical protein